MVSKPWSYKVLFLGEGGIGIGSLSVSISPIIMEVENYPKWKETTDPFSTEPWLWEEE